MKFFIGAKNLSGQVAIAEIIDATDFENALFTLRQQAAEEIGPGKYRVTAVNELDQYEHAPARARVAEFLDSREEHEQEVETR